MSDPKNISPLLDGFILGSPISEHHGVVCCPAIKENSNKKCIVKIVSVPATQAQFDALMLAGAYKDPGDAMEYFRENGENILKEAELLKTLSKIEGFLPYDGWQMEPITRRRLGYEVYLVGSYKRSLEKYMRKNAFTHLEAVNLGLDLCAALSLCRQSGYVYVDLKPSNVYVSEKKEYRIGDLGFLSLDSLRYASLPERYYSPYTPPELFDPMAAMNLSVDTYAVGMILYQLYNDGHLPFSGISPTESLPSPVHADYEMAEIIMKAIHPDPEQRWLDPKDLGKAIASYMQRNSINDIPITPFIPLDVNPEDIVPVSAQEETAPEIIALEEDSLTDEHPPVVSDENVVPDDASADNSDRIAESEPDEDAGSLTDTEPTAESVSAEPVPDAEPESKNEDGISVEKPSIEAPDEADPSHTEVSEEVSRILSRADDIIAHEIPEETGFPVDPEAADPFSFVLEDEENLEEDISPNPLMEENEVKKEPEKKKKTKHFGDTTKKKKWKKFFSGCFTFLLFSIFCAAGYWFYQNVYLQTIDSMTISGTQNQITVLIDTDVDESKLSVRCTDKNGKSKSEPVHGGKASFHDLKASTEYIIEVQMDGFHKLIGENTDVFTTNATTQILDFQAIAGSEDGSVILEYTVEGDDPNFWYIHYLADGEEERTETATGHTAMISGLTVGKTYTFTLEGDKNFDLGGETTLQYLASKLILAEDLVVSTTEGNDIIVQWKTPGDIVVDDWSVRCYDGYGFEEQKTVTENRVIFKGIDLSSSYTVEIIAAGMTQPSRVSISSDPINVTDFHIDESSQTEMVITWNYTGNKPEGGWQLIYTVDGSGSQTIPCEKATAKISPLIPGANYAFTLQAADGRSVFNNMVQYHANDAELFSEFNVVLEDFSIDLVKTPEEKNWRCETISEDLFTNTFRVGDSASLALRSSSSFYLPGNKIKVLFVYRDAYGNVLPELVSEVSCIWKNIWSAGNAKNGELALPHLPSLPGEYKMELYFNGGFVSTFDMVITD